MRKMTNETVSEDKVPIIERYLILLLGSVDRPIVSSVHLQKEFFILSKAIPKIDDYLAFEKHYLGPYSVDLNDISNEPVYYSDAIQHNVNGKFSLSSKGKEIYQKIIEYNSKNKDFLEIIAMVKMVRTLYDKLSKNELLFLIYSTYEEYTEYSSVSSNLLSPQNLKHFAERLLRKKAITKKRYYELLERA